MYVQTTEAKYIVNMSTTIRAEDLVNVRASEKFPSDDTKNKTVVGSCIHSLKYLCDRASTIPGAKARRGEYILYSGD